MPYGRCEGSKSFGCDLGTLALDGACLDIVERHELQFSAPRKSLDECLPSD